jgi:hypothetical protein
MIEEITVQCPHCGEPYTTTVDTSQGDCFTIEDCWVCCRPMNLQIQCEPGVVREVIVTVA